MGYASKLGRARVSARNPQAAGQCDRCGFVYQHNRLRWQMDWAGASLINKRMLVCDICYDTPQEQLRSIIVPADPVPIQNPRVTNYVDAETDYRITQGNTINARTGIPVPGGDVRITEDNSNRVTQQTGEPPNGINMIPGTILNQPGYGNPGLPYNAPGIPETGWIPGVYYVLWNNGNTSPLTWQNTSSGVLTWVNTTPP